MIFFLFSSLLNTTTAAMKYQAERAKAQRLKKAAEDKVTLSDDIKKLFETVDFCIHTVILLTFDSVAR